MIVECHVWCKDNAEELIQMGLPEGDRWMPFSIDFKSVMAIKLAGEHDFLGNEDSGLFQ